MNHLISVIVALCVVISQLGVKGQVDELYYDLQEERDPIVGVADISTDSNVSSVLDPTEFSRLKFQLYSSLRSNNFHLNNMTGYLSAVQKIDRETVCGRQSVCVIRLNVGIQSLQPGSSFFHTITLYINILDINDNSPLFQEQSLKLAIPESTPTGTTYIIDGATDLDTGANNSVQSYALVPESPVFGIRTQRKLDGSMEVRLVVVASLDRENIGHYELTVRAYDGGINRKSGDMTLSINVTDINDNWPIFSKTTYSVNVNETAPIGISIIAVEATDVDEGTNGHLSYRFSSRQTDYSAVSFFGIDAQNGEIHPNKPLTPLQGLTKRIVVEAMDSGADAKISQCIVEITVLDNANNPPTIRLNLISENNNVDILESSSVGSLVAHFVTNDADSGVNGHVSCSTNTSDFGVRQIKANQYKIILNHVLDREESGVRYVTLMCQDGGQPSLQTKINLTVTVVDVNDNAPKFSKDTVYLNITENNENNIILTSVSATDKDFGENGMVYYKLGATTSTRPRVDVNHTTGDILVMGSFDYEVDHQVNITVIAFDGGDPSLSSTSTVYLRIIDENDNLPYFSDPVYMFNIKENLAPGTFRGKIQGHDDDSGNYGRLNYMLQPNSSLPFSISKDGDLTTTQSFDREEKASYEFRVIAYDLSESPKSADVIVTVSILDENDNTPQISYPRFTNHSVPVSYHTVPGSELIQVEAIDADEGDNARILYEIKSESKPDCFIIDQNSGSIFLNKQLTMKDIGNITVVVIVSDKGLDPRTSRINFTISITDGNLTALASRHDSDQNMLVVIALVSVTFVVAVVVLATVLFLKRTDQQKSHPKRTKYDSKDISDPAFRKGVQVSSSGKELRKNEMELNDKAFHASQPSNEELIVFKMKLAEKYQVEGGDSSFSKETEISDVMSSVSGETTGCDSGRGASEGEGQDDVNGSVPNSPRKQFMTFKGQQQQTPSYYRLDQIKSGNSIPQNQNPARQSINLTDSYKIKSGGKERSNKIHGKYCDNLKPNGEKNNHALLRPRSDNYESEKQYLKVSPDNYHYLENNNLHYDPRQHLQKINSFNKQYESVYEKEQHVRFSDEKYRHSIGQCHADYAIPHKYRATKCNSDTPNYSDVIVQRNQDNLEHSKQRNMSNSFRNSNYYPRDTDGFSVDTMDDGQSTTTSGSYTVETDQYTDDIYSDARYVTHLNHNPEDVFV